MSDLCRVGGAYKCVDILEQMLPRPWARQDCHPHPLTHPPLLIPYPIGSCHLHDHLGGSWAEVAAVAAHHHGAALPVPQVDGGQHALDVVLQVVLLALEHRRLPPQPVGAGSLVVEGGGLDRQHRDGARLHPPSCGDPASGSVTGVRFCLVPSFFFLKTQEGTQRGTAWACEVRAQSPCRGAVTQGWRETPRHQSNKSPPAVCVCVCGRLQSRIPSVSIQQQLSSPLDNSPPLPTSLNWRQEKKKEKKKRKSRQGQNLQGPQSAEPLDRNRPLADGGGGLCRGPFCNRTLLVSEPPGMKPGPDSHAGLFISDRNAEQNSSNFLFFIGSSFVSLAWYLY